ncbi:hypothetical protein [Desulfopila aestuarii]|uniref:Uncharacterized protein n=1 Tax=Desulfopila aestuarii DSM 18488 TaxID=1121416 RepID=A0A1M7YHE8_9BACT|nr:hypothetical protein [Desulfopila aestuarii]SHO52050.1 hypothetical protein SAMN02745220_04342 [Desulfopila aestuarii DSM 18488]
MDIEEFARTSRLTRKILRWMVRKKVVENPLTEEDLAGLRLLEKIWGKSEMIRLQLAKYSKARRLQLLTSPDFETKWERYAYTRFSNLESGVRLPMKQLINELELTFGFIFTRPHIKRLYKVKQKVYNKRKAIAKSDMLGV